MYSGNLITHFKYGTRTLAVWHEIGVLWYSRENKFEILIFDLLEFDETIGIPATLRPT